MGCDARRNNPRLPPVTPSLRHTDGSDRVAQPPSAVIQGGTAEGGCATFPSLTGRVAVLKPALN
jgi:hypothetical protein